MPQVAIRWLLQQPTVPSVVIGVRTMDQLLDNMAANSFELSSQEVGSNERWYFYTKSILSTRAQIGTCSEDRVKIKLYWCL